MFRLPMVSIDLQVQLGVMLASFICRKYSLQFNYAKPASNGVGVDLADCMRLKGAEFSPACVGRPIKASRQPRVLGLGLL